MSERLGPKYPDSPPEIKVTRKKGVQSSYAAQIQERIIHKAKELVGNEMIFELTELAKELLLMAGRKKVSFHDEMTMRKSTEKPSESSDTKDIRPSAEQEELALRIQQDLELKERTLRATKEKALSQDLNTTRSLTFDPPLCISFPDSETPISIRELRMGELIVELESYAPSYEAHAIDDSITFHANCIKVESPFYYSAHGRKKLISTVSKINDMSKIRFSPLYARVVGASLVDVDERSCELWIIHEPHTGFSLESLLKCSGTFSLPKAIMYLDQILQSLQELHTNTLAHQDLTLSNIFVAPMLAKIKIINPVVTRIIKDLNQIQPISSKLNLSEDIVWRPPEIVSRGGQGGKKADIWFAGCLMLQMVFGIDFPKRHDTVQGAFEVLEVLPVPLRHMIMMILSSEPAQRPSIAEILRSEAFSDKIISQYGSMDIIRMPPLHAHHKTAKDSTIFATSKPLSSSRYKTDFEEIQFLGKGAFGEVIKVRNKIDNRFYAIKKIRLDPTDVEHNNKILREVSTLSRLHHDRIVRYYQAWIEGSSSSTHALKKFNSNDTLDADLDSDEEYSLSDTNESDSEWSREGVSSRRVYSSNLISSTVSLSSLVQFHTGFTSEEGSMTTSEYSPSSSKPLTANNERGDSFQYLYIQMEYCPNQTLRDIIDMGIDFDEAWRLFRQIIEGLCHLHSQGMIHRDLKPGNIFLDTNGDIKIGDFGLAVGDDHDRFLYNKHQNEDRGAEVSESLTGGIGTPLYISPEQERPGSRYNQKVDMYSLGIILLELLVPFKTTMERIMVIKDVREAQVKLPEILSKPEFRNAALIIKNLLNHDPKARFSSSELLKNDLLPAKMEDEYVNDAIRAIIKPSSSHFKKLLSNLFTQPVDPLKDFTFDFRSGTSNDPALLSGADEMIKVVTLIFRKHSAIQFGPPLLLAKTDNYDGPTLLMTNGQVVQLPFDLVRPFARYIAQNEIFDMKRFVIDRVFRENPTGGQPKQFLEASFDIVFSHNDPIMPELQVLKITNEITNAIAGASTPVVLRLNHHDILSAVLSQSLVPNAKRSQVFSLLALYSTASWAKIKNILGSEIVLSSACIESLSKLYGIKGNKKDD